MMRSLRTYLLGMTLALLLGASARADIYVVVNMSNPVQAMTQKEALDVFMGRRRAFATGNLALPFDLPRDNTTRTAFYEALTGMSLTQVNSYWARLMFTGQTLPPQSLASEMAMEEIVKQDLSAIGYLSRPPADPSLRVVLVLRDPR